MVKTDHLQKELTMFDTSDFHPLPGRVPLHVGIIPDGGRRWAHAHQCTLGEVYSRTRELLYQHVERMLAYGVKDFSIYISSIQNFRREHREINAMLDAVGSSLEHEIDILSRQHELKVVVAGHRTVLPVEVVHAVNQAEEKTRGNRKGKLNLLLAYDPLEEIIQAFHRCSNYQRFYEDLWITKPVDLVIRTGGAQLLSNFMPLQCGYARLYCYDKLFNDFTTADLDEVLHHFSGLDRKFGT